MHKHKDLPGNKNREISQDSIETMEENKHIYF